MQDNSLEIFPVVDTDGSVIGHATRGECHSGSKLLHPVVHLHVLDSQGRLYLQKRPQWKDIQPGKWDTAVGGHVDYGEDVTDALLREAREELGLCHFTPTAITSYVFESARERELVNVFMTVCDSSDVRPSAELDGGRFWSFDEIGRNIGKGIFTPNFEQEYLRILPVLSENRQIPTYQPTMKKYAMDMTVHECVHLNTLYALLKLRPASGAALPEPILPGQFVQVEVPDSKSTFLRRPISVNFVDRGANLLWLLVRVAGEGTRHLAQSKPGDTLNVILPLGHGFSRPADKDARVLLVGGGVGVAPLLYLGACLKEDGYAPEFALGARSASDLLQLDDFRAIGPVHVSTEDGSVGEKGFITQHSVFSSRIGHIACCGPTPMMKAVAAIAASRGINCEVSLENMMACGLGACLCCVEDTDAGNVCVCTDGPVFNINQLKWQL